MGDAEIKDLNARGARLQLRPSMTALTCVRGMTMATFTEAAELPFELPITSAYVDFEDWSPEYEARLLAAPGLAFTSLRYLHAAGIHAPRSISWIESSWLAARLHGLDIEGTAPPLQALMRMYERNRQVKYVLGRVEGQSYSFKRNSIPDRPRLEISVGASDRAVLDHFDAIDGAGWVLSLELKYALSNEYAEHEHEEQSLQERFPSFIEVRISEPPVYSYEGGM